MSNALSIVLEFTRITAPDDPHTFRFEPQGYTLRGPAGGLERFDIPWSADLLAALDALRQPGRDPVVVQRLGDVMQRALRPIGWTGLGEQIRGASAAGRPVLVTLRSNAAELYALPWELLTVGASGQHLGELPGVLLRHEWPATATSPERPAPRSEGGRVLIAWSAAGGAVPAAEHRRALAAAWSEGHVGFDLADDVLPHATPGSLAEALAAAEAAGDPFTVLHLLAHGGATGSTFGLALDGENGSAFVVDAGRLRQLLAPHAGSLRLVVLAACNGGHAGSPGNHLGSVAQALHRAGIQSVVASRYPLSVDGSIALAESLYHSLLVELHPLEHAFTVARAHLARHPEHLDWASLQLYARAADGDDTRPIVFCPYRGLLVFEARHRRFFFGRDAERRETLGDLQALIDAGRPRFLVVVGASGTGKSSMVLAGVVPEIAHVRSRRKGPWQVLTMVPGAAPLAALRDLLRRRTDEQPLLLVVDQFEELFTHTPDPAARTDFVRQLWSLSRGDTGIHVIVTLRVDFLGHCGELIVDDTGLSLDRVAYDEAHRVFVARMASDQIRTAIERPAGLVGLTFGSGLLARILADVGAEPGALPLLQYALGRLWQQRRGHILAAEVYEEIGGLVGALEKDADELIAGLDDEQRQHARRLLTQLVDTREDETADTRRRVAIPKLEPTDAGRRATFDALVTRLVDARLVVRSGEGAAPTLEIAHEALIRRWGILRGWINEDRVVLVELEKLRAWARDWAEHKTLLSGTKLDRASEFVRQHRDDIEEPVRRLVQASEDEHRRLAEAGDAQRRRRRNAVGAVIAILVVGVLGMAGVSVYALEQRSLAQAQERRANEVMKTAKELTEELLSDVLPKYANIPGTVPVQRELHGRLETMLKLLLAAGAEDDQDVLGLEIEQRIERGRLALTHEGLDEAREKFQEALALAEKWNDADPGNTRARHKLAIVLIELGDVEKKGGDLEAARTDFERSRDLLEPLAAADPPDAPARIDHAVCLGKLGEVAQQGGDLAAARVLFERSADLLEALSVAHPAAGDLQRELSIALTKIADAALEGGDLAAARPLFDRALKKLEALAAAAPTGTEARRDLAVMVGRVADVEHKAGNLAAARALHERSASILEALASADQTSAEIRQEFALCLGKIGDVAEAEGDLAAARTAFERALVSLERLAADDPTNAETQRLLAVFQLKLGEVVQHVGDPASARATLDRGLKRLEGLFARNPTNSDIKLNLAIAHRMIGNLELEADDFAAARTCFERARTLLDGLAVDDATNSAVRDELYATYGGLGATALEIEDLPAARAAFERALEIVDAAAKHDPKAPGIQRELSVALNRLGDVEMQAGNLGTARTLFQRDLEIAEALAKADATDIQAQGDLRISLHSLGSVELQAGELAAARTAFERELELAQKIAAGTPNDAEANFAVAVALARLFDIASAEEDRHEQVKHLRAMKLVLDAMAGKAQIAGDPEREQLRDDVKQAFSRLALR